MSTIVLGFPGVIQLSGAQLLVSQAKVMNGTCAVNCYDTLKQGATNYQVPTGKKLIIWALRTLAISASAVNVSVGYADTASNNSGAAPTNPVNLSSVIASSAASAGSVGEVITKFEIPAGKYPYLFGQTGTNYFTCLCQEVNA